MSGIKFVSGIDRSQNYTIEVQLTTYETVTSNSETSFQENGGMKNSADI